MINVYDFFIPVNEGGTDTSSFSNILTFELTNVPRLSQNEMRPSRRAPWHVLLSERLGILLQEPFTAATPSMKDTGPQN